MNRQQVLDQVVSCIVAQGGPSFSKGKGMCLYRGPDGRKCAAGCLLPDDRYDPMMEGSLVSTPRIASILQELVEPEAWSFFKTLQEQHDNAAFDARYDGPAYGPKLDGGPEFDKAFMRRWKDRMRGHALTWGLRVPEVLKEPDHLET